MEYIKRAVEDIVNDSFNTYKAVLISGARQTGKSTLVSELFPDIKNITFDDPFLEDQAKNNPEMFMMLNEPPVSMDEVQHVPELFRYLKMECDRTDSKGLFVLTGSQPFRLMELAADSLAGRIALIELAPLSLREISGADYNKPFIPDLEYIRDRQKSVVKPRNIWEIIHRGGYPALQDRDLDWQRFFANYIKTYLERDVRELSAVHDLDAFRRFMVACASRTGQLLNYSNIASEIEKDADTIKKWISILEASGIIYLLEPFSSSALKRVIKAPKLYFRDTGLAAYLGRWLTPETLANGAMNGAFFETFVISEMIKSYSNRGFDYHYFISYYRGKDRQGSGDNEIDFIIEQDGVLYPVEIKMTSKATAEMTSAFRILDKVPEKKRGTGAVVCMCPSPGALRENILQIPVWYI